MEYFALFRELKSPFSFAQISFCAKKVAFSNGGVVEAGMDLKPILLC
jgi:hypothetical protein